MIEAIGWLTVFVGGGFAFATLSAFVVLYLTSRQGLGALLWGDLTFKVALVAWAVAFFWFAPITIAFGATP
jgi:uncharacterized membrane protein